ncbi:MAG: acyl carrier protein [Thiothrix sp.]|nr:MAG: acyl carrier protein [Thiothrix sp.]
MTETIKTHEQLEEVFKAVFNDDSIQLEDSTTAKDIPGWDSVAHINLMLSVEQSFGLQFSGDQFSDFENIGELKAFLSR